MNSNLPQILTGDQHGVLCALLVVQGDHLDVDVRAAFDDDGLLPVGPRGFVGRKVAGVLKVDELRGRSAERANVKSGKYEPCFLTVAFVTSQEISFNFGLQF